MRVIFLIIFLKIVFTQSLFAQTDENLIKSLKEHSDEVSSVAFSIEGKQFISGSADKQIIIWDFETFQPVKKLQRHYAAIYDLQYFPDGKYFASAGDKSINIWKNDGTYIKTLSGHGTAVWSIDISENGKYLVSGSFDNNFRLWDILKGECLHIFDNNKKSILSTAFSPGNNLIAAGSQDGSIDIFTFDDFALIHTLPGHGGNIYSLSFSPDGKFLASAARDNTIKIWDMDSMKIVHALTGHERSVMSVRFSKNGRYLVSGSFDSSVRLWDVKSGGQIYAFWGHTMPVNDVDISADCKYIISGSSDNTVNVWEIHPQILIDFYFANEFQSELNKSGLFEPKKPGESRAEYKDRQERAEKFKNGLYQKYLDRLNQP